MLEQENVKVTRRSFSLGSVLLIVLIIAFGAGLTAYTLGSTFAAVTGTASSTSQQSSSTSTTTTTIHNCTRSAG